MRIRERKNTILLRLSPCHPLQEESMSVPIEKPGESTFPKMLRCFSPSPFVSFGSDTKAPDPSFHRLDAQDFLFITLTR